MAGEVIAFSDLFDIAVTLAAELGDVFGRQIPVQLFTDSKSLFDVSLKGHERGKAHDARHRCRSRRLS